MPLFQKRVNSGTFQTASLGDRLDFEVTREFHIEAIILEVEATVGTTAATPVSDGLAAIVQRLNIQTNDGQNNRNVVSSSGMGIIEQFIQETGQIDARTRTAMLSGLDNTNTERLFYPVFFAPPQMADPTRSAFLLPAPRFNTNIQVSVDLATTAQLDINGTPTLAISSVKARLHVLRRVVDIASWVTYDQEFKEVVHEFPSTGDGQIIELDTPGNYGNVLCRFYDNAAPTTRLNAETVLGANGLIRLQALDTSFATMGAEVAAALNAFTEVGVEVDGATAQQAFGPNGFGRSKINFDFLTDGLGSSVRDLGSMLDSNPYVATGSRIKLLTDIADAANIKLVTRRFYGDLSPLKFQKKQA